MKPEYWIGILAILGSVLGTIVSFIVPTIHGSGAATTGTIVGVAAGTAIYAALKEKHPPKE